MTDEQKAAYINAMCVCAQATLEGMKALNRERESSGSSIAYSEEQFLSVIEEYRIGHNDVISFFRD